MSLAGTMLGLLMSDHRGGVAIALGGAATFAGWLALVAGPWADGYSLFRSSQGMRFVFSGLAVFGGILGGSLLTGSHRSLPMAGLATFVMYLATFEVLLVTRRLGLLLRPDRRTRL